LTQKEVGFVLKRWALFVLLIAGMGCSGDLRSDPVDTSALWPELPSQETVKEPITFVPRGEGAQYGLPRAAEASSIADLIALLPNEDVGFGDARTFTSSAGRLLCPSGGQEVLAQLPMDIEGVVTLHPRRYMKIPVCDQDEKHYGVFTIEDDTGGIVVLRDSRIAHFDVGDRVRMRVHALTLTYLGPETRAVLSASTELLEATSSIEGVQGSVLYETTDEPFGLADFSRVRRVTGYTVQSPTNKNFSSLVISNRYIPEPNGADVDRICELNCLGQCNVGAGGCGEAVCSDLICKSLCEGAGATFNSDALPICWQAGLDTELARRGYSYPLGSHLSVTGPVVDNYDVQIWVQQLGQIEVLGEN